MLKKTKEVARYAALASGEAVWERFENSKMYSPDLNYIMHVEDNSDEEISIDAFVIYQIID